MGAGGLWGRHPFVLGFLQKKPRDINNVRILTNTSYHRSASEKPNTCCRRVTLNVFISTQIQYVKSVLSKPVDRLLLFLICTGLMITMYILNSSTSDANVLEHLHDKQIQWVQKIFRPRSLPLLYVVFFMLQADALHTFSH